MKKTSLIFLVSCLLSLVFVSAALASTDINSVNRYAWNDVIGWIDFYITDNVRILSNKLTGYASSSAGYIALDCSTAPVSNCSTGYGVSNDGNGNLSGWAWNDGIGWISFDSATAGSSFPYQVTINPANGDWSGWAWNEIIGWISFNCSNTGTCPISNYKVSSSWSPSPAYGNLESSVFDSGIASGTTLNSILWQGIKPSGTLVQFQIATSNSSSGPWAFKGPNGTDGTFYTPTGVGVSTAINPAYHANQRYFRYKVFLQTDAGQTASPKVDDIIVNWSL